MKKAQIAYLILVLGLAILDIITGIKHNSKTDFFCSGFNFGLFICFLVYFYLQHRPKKIYAELSEIIIRQQALNKELTDQLEILHQKLNINNYEKN